MNKFGMVLGAAAVVTLAGCKDPDYKYAGASESQNEVKSAESVAIESTPTAKCKCLPGTKHAGPCPCGASDCACVDTTKTIEVTKGLDLPPAPVQPAPVAKPVPPPKAPESDTTVYVVQSGDSLSRISKKYNVTISSMKRLNPHLKGDRIRIGQKLRLPGKLDVPPAPLAAPTAKPAKVGKHGYAPYTGATKDYVVKSGDTLGAVAYGNGCNIRQLRELNALKTDTLHIGQKLKVPADAKAAKQALLEAKAAKKAAKKSEVKAVKAEKAPEAKAAPEAKPAEVKPETKPEAAPAAEAAPAPAAETKPAEAAEKAAAPAPAPTTTYVVQEGDDMTGVSIRFGVSAAAIRELNNLGPDAQLAPGQILKLPADASEK